jgi:hypothetical protein
MSELAALVISILVAGVIAGALSQMVGGGRTQGLVGMNSRAKDIAIYAVGGTLAALNLAAGITLLIWVW